MKLAVHLRVFAALALLLPNAFAAALDLKVTSSTSTPVVGTPIDFSITITNGSGVTLSPTTVRADYSSTAFTLIRTGSNIPTNSFPGANPVTVLPGNVAFQIDSFTAGQEYTFTMRLRPDIGGAQTVRFSALGQGNTASTNINFTASTGTADLQVLMTPVPAYAIAFDQIQYQIIATNPGAASVPSVVVTNFIPGTAKILFNSVGSALTRPRTNQLTWNVGTLTNGTARILTLNLQETNTGTFPITALIFAANNIDSGTNNNFVSNTIIIQPLISTNLQLTRGTNFFNRDTALIEEIVTVRNLGSNTIPGVRVLVEGMTSPHRLYNVAGTNGVLPFVADTNVVAAGQIIPVRMQYFFKDRTPHPLTLTAIQGPGLATTTNQIGLTSTNLTVTNNTVSLNFPTTAGLNYTVQYSDTVPFPTNATVMTNINAAASNVMISQPLVTNVPQRFFRAIETR